MKIYRVRVEETNVERFTIRASTPEEAKELAENLTSGCNISVSETTIEREDDDAGQECDND